MSERLVMLSDSDMRLLSGAKWKRGVVIHMSIIMGMLSLLAFVQHVELKGSQRMLDSMKTKVSAAEQSRDIAVARLEKYRSMMSVALDLDSKRFSKPIRIKGDIILTVAGEVSDN